MRHYPRFLIVALALIIICSGSLAWTLGEAAGTVTDELHCATSNAIVEAHPGQENMPAREICRFVRRALDHLSVYGLTVDRLLRIKVVEQIEHSCDVPPVGQFDSREFQIRIISFERCIEDTANHPVLSAVPPREWYGSLIGHEVAHAAFATFSEMHNALPARTMAQEYLAYAIQLKLLSGASRNTLLKAFPRQAPKDLSVFNSTYLLLNPLAFATNAYRHLFYKANPQNYIFCVLAGKIEFPNQEQND